MNKKVLRFAFKSVLDAAENVACKDLHHTKGQYHEYDEVCKAEYALQKQAFIVREYMKELGL